MGSLDDAFFATLPAAASALSAPPSYLLMVGYIESRLDPQAHRQGSDFWGLTQINGPDVRRLSHLDPVTYLALPASGQLPTIVAWYKEGLAPLSRAPRSAGSFYAVNLAPGVLASKGDDPATVLYAAPDRRYYANKGLDVNGDGAITVGDLDAYAFKLQQEPAFQAALARAGTEAPYGSSPADPRVVTTFSAALPIALGGALGAALAIGLFELRNRSSRRNPVPRDLYIAGGVAALGAVVVAAALLSKRSPPQLPQTGLAVFPIADAPGASIHFTDDFGAARVGHSHQGNDLFATEGTPVIAPAAGRLTYTSDGVPGPPGSPPPLSFHLTDSLGTFYFGTHLASLTGQVGETRDVPAGFEIGTVGRGGNAAGTPPHLHFEVHPHGGAAVDPYPLILHLPRLSEPVA